MNRILTLIVGLLLAAVGVVVLASPVHATCPPDTQNDWPTCTPTTTTTSSTTTTTSTSTTSTVPPTTDPPATTSPTTAAPTSTVVSSTSTPPAPTTVAPSSTSPSTSTTAPAPTTSINIRPTTLPPPPQPDDRIEYGEWITRHIPLCGDDPEVFEFRVKRTTTFVLVDNEWVEGSTAQRVEKRLTDLVRPKCPTIDTPASTPSTTPAPRGCILPDGTVLPEDEYTVIDDGAIGPGDTATGTENFGSSRQCVAPTAPAPTTTTTVLLPPPPFEPHPSTTTVPVAVHPDDTIPPVDTSTKTLPATGAPTTFQWLVISALIVLVGAALLAMAFADKVARYISNRRKS